MNDFDGLARCVEGPAWRWRRAERTARTAREDPAGLLALPTNGYIREAVAYVQCCRESPDGEQLAKAPYPRSQPPKPSGTALGSARS